MKSTLILTTLPAMLVAGTFAALAQEPAAPAPATAPAEKISPAPVDPAASTPVDTPAATTLEKPSTTAAAPAATAPGTFATAQDASELRSSKIVGLTVYNDKNESVGKVDDLILDNSGKITTAVLGVGGFLGLGEKAVAMPYSDLSFNRDANGKIRVTVSTTKQALESAPEFKYYEKS